MVRAFATGRTTMQDLSATLNRRFEGLNIIINLAATDFALVTINEFGDQFCALSKISKFKKIWSQLDRNEVVSLV